MSQDRERRAIISELDALRIKTFEIRQLSYEQFRDHYNQVVSKLENYARHTHSRFINEKLKELPEMRESLGPCFFDAVAGLLNILMPGGLNVPDLVENELKENLLAIRGICDSIIAVLSTPGLEEMYYNKEK